MALVKEPMHLLHPILNFATVAAFDLFVQKTSLKCARLVKASTRSCTRLFSSDKFRATTDKSNVKDEIRNKLSIESKKTRKGLALTVQAFYCFLQLT
jgi:hypothetical protein